MTTLNDETTFLTKNATDLSTRELLEQNWDKFINEQTTNKDDAINRVNIEDKDEKQNAKTVIEPDKNIQGEDLNNNFNYDEYLSRSFEDIKSIALKKGLDSKEKWLQSVIEISKCFYLNPTEALRQLALDVAIPLPKKEDAPKLIASLEKNPNYQHLFQSKTQPLGFETLSLLNKAIQQTDAKNIQKMIKDEITSFFNAQKKETAKAETAAFFPTGKPRPQADHTRTLDGRLKTTREILEEGCKLLGI